MADVTNVDIGPCSVSLQGIDLGHTEGGVEVTYEPEFVDLHVDQYGNTNVESALLGEKLSAKCMLAEVTIANLHRAITNSTLATSGANKMLKLGTDAGVLQSQFGGQLILHPLHNLANDLSEDWTLYKVVVKANITDKRSPDDQRLWEVTFDAMIDEAKASGNRLGHYGTHIS